MPDNINYERVDWKNGDTGGTALNATNLNNMDSAIADLEVAIIDLNEKLKSKKNTFILDTEMTVSYIRQAIHYDGAVVEDGLGNSITDRFTNGQVSDSYIYNKYFNTNNQEGDIFPSVQIPSEDINLLVLKQQTSKAEGSKETYVYKPLKYFEPGDVFLVRQSEVPDRWYAGTVYFNPLETKKVSASDVSFNNSNVKKAPYFIYDNKRYQYRKNGGPPYDTSKYSAFQYVGDSQNVSFTFIYLEIPSDTMDTISPQNLYGIYSYSGLIYQMPENNHYVPITGGGVAIYCPLSGETVQVIVEQLAIEHTEFDEQLNTLFKDTATVLSPTEYYEFAPNEQNLYLISGKYGFNMAGVAHIKKVNAYSDKYCLAINFFGVCYGDSMFYHFLTNDFGGGPSSNPNFYTETQLISGEGVLRRIQENLTPENVVGNKKANEIPFDDTVSGNYYIENLINGVRSGIVGYIEYVDWAQEDGYLAIRCDDGSVNYIPIQPLTVGHTFGSNIYEYKGPVDGYVPITGGKYIIDADYPADNVQDAIAALYQKIKDAVLNIENGTGTNAIQMKQEVSTIDYTGRNPNATTIDSTITGTIEIGAKGAQSATFGKQTTAMNLNALAEGNKTIAKGEESHAEGYQSVALGNGSHAEGNLTVSSGTCSHSEGNNTIASGEISHAEGFTTQAIGEGAHAEGAHTVARGDYSHAGGLNTEANHDGQTVVGHCNDNKETTVFEVGCGWKDENGNVVQRQNAFEVYKDGHAEVGAMGTTDLSVATKEYVDNADFVRAIDYTNTKFTLTDPETFDMPHQHIYQIGSLVFVHLVFRTKGQIETTGLFTLGKLDSSILPQHVHSFTVVPANPNVTNDMTMNPGYIALDGTISFDVTKTYSTSNYTFDITTFYCTDISTPIVTE